MLRYLSLLGLALLAALSLAAATPAAPFDWPIGASRVWEGTWTAPGSAFTVVATMTRTTADHVEGQLDWRQEPDGRRGTEWIRGTYDAAAGKLDVAGYRVSDPKFLVTDVYALSVDVAGNLAGPSRNYDGSWSGQFFAHLRPGR